MENKKLITDYMRQLDWYSPKASDCVLVIGCGSIGSYHAYALARMGVPKVIVVDYDVVEEHNLPNQFFSEIDIVSGLPKVSVLHKTTDMMLRKNPIIIYENKIENVLKEIIVKHNPSVISVTVDSMSVRKRIWDIIIDNEHLLHNNISLVDGRVGGLFANVYAVELNNESEKQYYKSQLYPDSDVPDLPCTARSIVDVSFQVAGAMATEVRKFLREKHNVCHTFWDYGIGQSYTLFTVNQINTFINITVNTENEEGEEDEAI